MLDFDLWCNEQLYDFKGFLTLLNLPKDRINDLYVSISKYCSICIVKVNDYPEDVNVYMGNVLIKIRSLKKSLKSHYVA